VPLVMKRKKGPEEGCKTPPTDDTGNVEPPRAVKTFLGLSSEVHAEIFQYCDVVGLCKLEATCMEFAPPPPSLIQQSVKRQLRLDFPGAQVAIQSPAALLARRQAARATARSLPDDAHRNLHALKPSQQAPLLEAVIEKIRVILPQPEESYACLCNFLSILSTADASKLSNAEMQTIVKESGAVPLLLQVVQLPLGCDSCPPLAISDFVVNGHTSDAARQLGMKALSWLCKDDNLCQQQVMEGENVGTLVRALRQAPNLQLQHDALSVMLACADTDSSHRKATLVAAELVPALLITLRQYPGSTAPGNNDQLLMEYRDMAGKMMHLLKEKASYPTLVQEGLIEELLKLLQVLEPRKISNGFASCILEEMCQASAVGGTYSDQLVAVGGIPVLVKTVQENPQYDDDSDEENDENDYSRANAAEVLTAICERTPSHIDLITQAGAIAAALALLRGVVDPWVRSKAAKSLACMCITAAHVDVVVEAGAINDVIEGCEGASTLEMDDLVLLLIRFCCYAKHRAKVVEVVPLATLHDSMMDGLPYSSSKEEITALIGLIADSEELRPALHQLGLGNDSFCCGSLKAAHEYLGEDLKWSGVEWKTLVSCYCGECEDSAESEDSADYESGVPSWLLGLPQGQMGVPVPMGMHGLPAFTGFEQGFSPLLLLQAMQGMPMQMAAMPPPTYAVGHQPAYSAAAAAEETANSAGPVAEHKCTEGGEPVAKRTRRE